LDQILKERQQEMISSQISDPVSEFTLTIDEDQIQRFFHLLQQGFMVEVKVGCTIKKMFGQQFGISPEYLEGRIQTIFLDGKAVDNTDAAMVRDGSALALSAAMPGLVGATFRKGGCLASFRSQITHAPNDLFAQRQDGNITLKIFNLLLQEMGPQFLSKGILISGDVLVDFLRQQPPTFWTGIKTATLDGQELDLRGIVEEGWPGKQIQYIRLRVLPANERL
jgi:hypothetical protein